LRGRAEERVLPVTSPPGGHPGRTGGLWLWMTAQCHLRQFALRLGQRATLADVLTELPLSRQLDDLPARGKHAILSCKFTAGVLDFGIRYGGHCDAALPLIGRGSSAYRALESSGRLARLESTRIPSDNNHYYIWCCLCATASV